MTVELADRGVRLVLLDIEGTTTPMAFVHEILFPFARARLAAWCRARAGTDEYRESAEQLAREHLDDRARGEPVPPWRSGTPVELDESLRAYVGWLMDRDRKSSGLKRLQGLIWDEGYQAGELHGLVYPDVPSALRRWRAQDIDVAIYSSGSELAQRRLFASTAHGDLTPLIVAFFDTAVGPKRSASSYARIVAALNHHSSRALFVSDVTAELDAAAGAGCQVVLSIRSGNPVQPDSDRYDVVHGFDELV